MTTPSAPQTSAPGSPFGLVLLAWLVPGLGHVRLGRAWSGLFIALAVLGLFVGGMALTGWVNVHPDRHPVYFVTHVFVGLPTGLATFLTGELQISRPHPYREIGELYSALAGLLNAIAIADVWARARGGDEAVVATSEGAVHG